MALTAKFHSHQKELDGIAKRFAVLESGTGYRREDITRKPTIVIRFNQSKVLPLRYVLGGYFRRAQESNSGLKSRSLSELVLVFHETFQLWT